MDSYLGQCDTEEESSRIRVVQIDRITGSVGIKRTDESVFWLFGHNERTIKRLPKGLLQCVTWKSSSGSNAKKVDEIEKLGKRGEWCMTGVNGGGS